MGTPILLKIVSENRFSGKTYFYTIASSVQHGHGDHDLRGDFRKSPEAAELRLPRGGEGGRRSKGHPGGGGEEDLQQPDGDADSERGPPQGLQGRIV